jgi:hypothetical protein
MKNYDSDL